MADLRPWKTLPLGESPFDWGDTLSPADCRQVHVEQRAGGFTASLTDQNRPINEFAIHFRDGEGRIVMAVDLAIRPPDGMPYLFLSFDRLQLALDLGAVCIAIWVYSYPGQVTVCYPQAKHQPAPMLGGQRHRDMGHYEQSKVPIRDKTSTVSVQTGWGRSIQIPVAV